MSELAGKASKEIPPACDSEVFAQGHMVLMTHTIGSSEMETWVKQIAAVSGQRVDWHYAGGRACVLALGDMPRVYAAISQLMAEHDRLQTEAAMDGWNHYTEESPFRPSCLIYGTDETNTAHEYMRQINRGDGSLT